MTPLTFDDARPDDDERAHLAAGVGRELRRLRTAAELTQGQLAERIGAGRRTVQRLECGQRRPRASLLAALAAVLAPDAPEPLAERLADLAGASLAADTRRSARVRALRFRSAAPRRADPPAA
ncbi:helix-turn-helix transcriptional regulator [Actinomycetospora soli]|uniref:helix-turn-helix transcriptional regulator n=1 Tax=Actinomycetospora soli TaxID=2893887 RepID=UPI001E566658|nr:helix-turn-helix transcriptional regulator [Actinomycetospora soli]MCD2191648.1 helix-turn-helix domain-containing protein [Actinomycetospora soli]